MTTYLNFKFKAKAYTVCVCLLLFSVSCKNHNDDTIKKPISKIEKLENLYRQHLVKAYTYLDSINLNNNSDTNKKHYLNSRMYFKKCEPILSYTDKNNYKSLNSPNLLRIQEEDLTDVKINNPIGYQVIEELLFSEEGIDSLALTATLDITKNRLKLIERNFILNFEDKTYHILWLIRNAVVRVATTGLSNFDSPVFGASLQESIYTYETLESILEIYEDEFKDAELLKKWKTEIKNTIKTLNTNFDDLDRFAFIKNHTHKQLELINNTKKDWKVEFPYEFALQNEVNSLFSKNTFNFNYFSDYKSDTTHLKTKIELGKKLFNDTRLSRDNNMACATCHIKEKAFTDGRVTFNNKIKRNTPTLNYSGLQQAFFLDSREGSLEGQIVGVVNNHDEFNSDLEHITKVVKNDAYYSKAFNSVYKRGINDMNIRHAIAAYVRSLNAFNSKFDNNINGKENTLTKEEKRGFNLFMGKTACATCHFPPLFNGTVPPDFNETELEIIGVPETAKNKKLDDDLGRFYLFNTEALKGAFKTPTIRNIALTAPYMHNGVYNTLEQVVDFYNKGGGAGLGFHIPNQTLPFDNLDLSDEEQKAIIAFMKTLSDN